MTRFAQLTLFLTATTLAYALPAHAQYNENRAVMERMERIEQELSLMQRQVGRGGSTSGGDMGGVASGPASGQVEVRLSAVEEEMRRLRGKLEENDFSLRKVTDQLDRLQKDTDFRFNELSGQGGAAAATPTAAPAATSAAHEPTAVKPVNEPAKPAGEPAPKAAAEEKQFDQPRDHYNHAFRLLNQTRYEEAARYFKSFTDKYPEDPLIGNAFYWLGETHYIQRDYVKAADNFRQGFEVLPSGPKAADNLLKLSMSLSALKRDKDACVVLDQLLVKFKNTSSIITQRAEQERSRINCQ